MTTLVTGATGFLGSHLAHQLCAEPEHVRVLVRPTSDRRRLAGLPVEIAVGDVTDPESVRRAVEGVERVYHVAALYELGTPDPARMRAINVEGTRHVLDAAGAGGLPAVYVSSVIALGSTGREPRDEAHEGGTPPRSHYEATKREAHALARERIAAGAPVRIALPVTIYGPDDPSLIGRFHGAYARGLLRVGAFPDTVMSLVHVDDCAAGLVAIAREGRDGEQYVLGAQVLSYREWFAALAVATGRSVPRAFLPDALLRRAAGPAEWLARGIGVRRGLVREGLTFALDAHWAFTGERARRELGWRPRPLAEGLAETMAWYREHPGAWREA